MTIILGVYSVFASALIVWAFRKTFFEKSYPQKIYDSIGDTPKVADQLTPKEKAELDKYISNISTDELSTVVVEPEKLAIPEIVELTKEQIPTIKKESVSLPRYELPKKAILSNLPPLNLMPPIKPAKQEKKPIIVQPKQSFLKTAARHGIRQFICCTDGKEDQVTVSKLEYGIKYTPKELYIFLSLEDRGVVFPLFFSKDILVIFGNGERTAINSSCISVCSDRFLVKDFEF